MRIKFKNQEYQTKAVNALVDVFDGQPYVDKSKYIFNRDNYGMLSLTSNDDLLVSDDENYYVGFENHKLLISHDHILSNIQKIQERENIQISETLITEMNVPSLDIEMETGTGKTYVYIKTMFELNKRYGFSKFIVVVPSIAIREGVKKTFEMTNEHFMDQYNKKARFFIYDSRKLDALEHFSSSSSINVMIINIQAFNSKGADARRIYEKIDEFGSRRPIDVVARNNPILILDEPQKMGGIATKESLHRFNPLFVINYSATLKIQHNKVFVLDALDAYNKKLVKKIEVKGFTIKNLRGTNGYIFLQDIVLSKTKPPMAKIELEIKYNKSINRETRLLTVGDNLYKHSRELEQYKDNFIIADIDVINNSVTFLNGETLEIGIACGDVSEKDIRRIQIRETIISHFEKEEELFLKNIKVLSLFFIDEVAKYRVYDSNGVEMNSEYGDIFENEYLKILEEKKIDFNPKYLEYLNSIKVNKTHKGYFSIDKKTGRKINSSVSKRETDSDDASAYDLILKDKERLLSFEEPTRFIFSHSALREGWDNPNVFQICTLKYSESDVQRHQEVGRGLRLCVNDKGDRLDNTIPNFDVHSINKLTVVANDSYESFIKGLQTEIKDTLYKRPTKATKEYFLGKTIEFNGEPYQITSSQATAIYKYLILNDYIDDEDKITDTYKNDLLNKNIAPFKVELEPIASEIHRLIQGIFDERVLKDMFENGNSTKIVQNSLNDNFYRKEFIQLWDNINHKYSYKVDFDSNELIDKSVHSINANLAISRMSYSVTTGVQKDTIDSNQLSRGDSFKEYKTKSDSVKNELISNLKYDLIGKIASGTRLTRFSVATILQKIDLLKFNLFKLNPEDFISKVTKLINEQKASLIVEHITYNVVDGKFDSSIFFQEKRKSDFLKAYKAKKHIQDFVFTDGTAEQSIERKFAEELDNAVEVCVFAKLPRGFHIPTPMGNYSPDWAIAFNEGMVKHVYFIAETKGSMDSLQLREIEKSKIACAEKLFNKLSSSKVKFSQVDSYQYLLDVMNTL